MRWWGTQVVPRLAEATLKGHEIGEVRGEACTPLRGRVLELGFGSGLNVRWYPAAVESVDAVEPSDLGWRLGEERRGRASIPIERSGLDGQRLSAPDDAYDSVLTTFTLCTIPDVAAALAEVRRVLRPGGVIVFLEHGLSPDPGVARWQRRLDPLERRLAGGCHLSRDVPALLRAAGLVVTELRADYLPLTTAATRPWSYGFRGVASENPAGDR